MAYGLWLYKELDTDYGSVRLEISKRDYTGEALEIEALAADGITLSMDGEEITDPIIGTQLSINIIDTGQVDTSEFFTPDSTLYAVALYYGSTLEWYGYLTPDSYIESLDYRDTIALTARDNLGRLNDFEFKQTRGMVSAVELIESLLAEVQCSQYINWSVDKVALAKGEGVSQTTSIQDIWVNTDLFVSEEMTYREVVEEILRGLGCQMRFRSGNNLIVVSISDFYLIADQRAIFIERSGVKEIKPAWKELSVTQDYGLIENFYNGHISEQEIGWETFFVPSQKSDKWEGDMIFANQYGWPTGIEDDQDTSIFINAIEPYGTYSAFVIPVKATKTTLKLTMQLNNTLRWLRDNVYRKTSNLYYGGDGANHVISYNITHHIQIIMRNAAGEKYIMSPGDWIRDDNILAHLDWFQFKLDDCVYDDESTWNKDKECSIQINTIPFDGDLLIAFRTATWDEENRDIPNYQLYAKIKDITLKFDNNIGEKSATVQIKAAHNVTEELELKLGQVPYGKGDYLAYAGGYYSSDGLPLIQWMRKPDDVNFYDLMELVAREHIHLNYDNYPLLSGTMMSSDRTKPLMLGKNIHYKGEIYTIVSGSLNVIKNAMDISIMQKVVPYQIAELAVINSPLESGSGSKVGSGNNEVIQFSGQAGNAKRIYQLYDSVEDEREDAYAIIDSENWDNAKRVKVSELGGLFNKAFEVQLDADGNVTAVIAKANLGARGGIAARYQGDWGDVPVTPTINSLADINDVTITNPTNGQGLVYRDGVWVNSNVGGGSGTNDWNAIINKPTTLAGYGITDALPLSGGTMANNAGISWSNNAHSWDAPVNGLECISTLNDTLGYYAGLSYKGFYGLQIRAYGGDTDYIQVRGFNYENWGTWRNIIHSGNIGSQSVASATKLQTARTIWGQSFDGLGDISGDITDCGFVTGGDGTTDGYFVGLASLGAHPYKGLLLYTYGSTPITMYTARTKRMVINESGNVLIGTTADSGYKLDVNGNVRLGSLTPKDGIGVIPFAVAMTDYVSTGWVGSIGTQYGSVLLGHRHSSSIDRTILGTSGSVALSINPDGGNILIGTTTDNGSKLQVDGDVIRNVLFLNTNHSNGPIVTQSYNGVNKTWWGYSPHLKGVYLFNQNDKGLFISDNDNVLIGDTADNGAKLQVQSGNYNIIHLHRNNGEGYGTAIYCSNNNGFLGVFGFNKEDDFIVVNGRSDSTSALFRVSSNTINLNTKTDLNSAVLVYKGTSSIATLHITNVTTTIDYSHIFVSNADSSRTDRPLVLQNGFGNVGIGVAQPSHKLQVAGNIYASGGITARYASDKRLKEDIHTISTDVALATIMALNPITFRWNAKATELCSWLNGESQGFIAQDYEALIPNSGSEMWGEYRGIDYNRTIPYIVAVEQNHETRLQYLERENAELKQELQTLKKEHYGNR